MKYAKRQIKCNVKGYPVYGLTEAVYVVECTFFLSQFSYCRLVWM